MALRELEKLDANIVVLPAMEITVGLSQQEVAELLRDPGVQIQAVQVPGQPSPAAMQLTSMRQQIVISITNGQFQFSDRSADTPPKTRLAEVAHGFVKILTAKGLNQYRAYGYNFVVSFDAPGDLLPAELIKNRFLNSDALSRRANTQFKGSGIKLYYDTSDAACALQIEPFGNVPNAARFFASINYHYDLSGGTFPPEDGLKSDFQGKWTVFTDLVERLLGQP